MIVNNKNKRNDWGKCLSLPVTDYGPGSVRKSVLCSTMLDALWTMFLSRIVEHTPRMQCHREPLRITTYLNKTLHRLSAKHVKIIVELQFLTFTMWSNKSFFTHTDVTIVALHFGAQPVIFTRVWKAVTTQSWKIYKHFQNTSLCWQNCT